MRRQLETRRAIRYFLHELIARGFAVNAQALALAASRPNGEDIANALRIRVAN
jgi:hypothetical protein